MPVWAGSGIPALQKRIQKDRKDTLYCMTRIREAQARLKKDLAKAQAAGETQPTDKWTTRATQERAAIKNYQAAQEKAQNDLAKANAELSAILSKGKAPTP